MIKITNSAEADAAIASLRAFPTPQVYPHEATMYGIGHWLKKRFGLPQFISFDNWEVGHSPPLTNDFRASDKRRKIPFLLYNRTQKANYDREGKTSLLVGSSFVHCKDLLGFRPSPTAAGTLAFPTHSSLNIDIVCDWDSYADALLALPERFQPVSVCLYFKQLLEGAHRPFLGRGMTVFCAGHMFDDAFPANFYAILRQFKYSSGNLPGSNTYYSVDFGVPFFLYGPDVKLLRNFTDDGTPVPQTETSHFAPENPIRPIIERECKMFSYDLAGAVEITPEQRAYVTERLGTDNVYSQEAIWRGLWLRYLRLVLTALPRKLLRDAARHSS